MDKNTNNDPIFDRSSAFTPRTVARDVPNIRRAPIATTSSSYQNYKLPSSVHASHHLMNDETGSVPIDDLATDSLEAESTVMVAPTTYSDQGHANNRAHFANTSAKRRIIAIGIVFTVIILIFTAVIVSTFFNKEKSDLKKASTSQKEVTSIPNDDLLSVVDSRELSGANKVTVNGPLELNNNLVVNPSTKPKDAKAGQLYFDNASKQFGYFDGQNFQSLVSDAVLSRLSGIAGAQTGQGLNLNNGILRNTGVLSLQGQTGNVSLNAGAGISAVGATIANTGVLSLQGSSGNVNLAAGNGIALNGLEVVNTGVTALSGTVGQVNVSAASGSIVLSLPQSIAPAAAPTFAGLSLTNALGIGSGGTGNNSYNTNGVIYYDGTKFVSSAPAMLPGQCLKSGPTGTPFYEDCVAGFNNGVTTLNGLDNVINIIGGSNTTVTTVGNDLRIDVTVPPAGVESLNGVIGNLSVANTSVSGTVITIDDASTTNKGIAQFNGVDFDVSAGNVSLDATVTKQGNTFNGANQLVQLNASGLLPTLNGSNLIELNGGAIATGTVANNRLVGNGTLTVSPGNGLGGGGSVALGGSTTLNVVAGDGIVSNASGVAVDSTVCRTAGNCDATKVNATTPGTAGRIAVFSAGRNIGDSYLLQNGSTLEIDATRNLSLLGGNVTVTGDGTFSGTVAAGLFNGNGSSITNLNGSNITTGIVANARLTNGGALTISPGTGLTGGGSVVLGGTTTLTLANTAVSAGTYGTASDVATFTVDAQGRLTAAGSTPIAIAGSQVTSGTVANARLVNSGALTVSAGTGFTGGGSVALGGSTILNLADTAVTPGAYGSASSVATYTVDQQGRLTAASSIAIAIAGSQVTSGTVANARLVNSGVLTVSPGNGLGGGGSVALGGSTALNVVAGDGIVSNASGVAVDSTVCRTAGNCDATKVNATTAGTTGRIAMFNAGRDIGDSYLLQNGSTLEIDATRNLSLLGGNVTVTGDGTFSGTVAAGLFNGNGSSITNLNGSNITTGVVANARLVNSGALSVLPGTGLTGGGSVVLGGTTTLTLANTAVSPGTYGSAADVATFTVDQQGRLTAAGSTPISILGTQITGGTVANARLVNNGVLTYAAGNGLTGGGALALGGSASFNVAAGDGIAVGSTVGVDATVCRTTGNCAASGGGVTAPVAGTAGRIAVFTGSQTVANSYLLQNGSTVEIDNGRNLSLVGGNVNVAGTGTFTGLVTAGSFNGDGAAITNINGSNVATGTVANARLINGGSLNVNAGNSGLSGGGGVALGASTSLSVVAGDGIQINSGVAVDNTVCRTSGNCAGTGTGVTASTAGNANRIAMFKAGQDIGDSYLLQNGSTLQLDATRSLSLLGGDLNVTGNGTFSGTVAAGLFSGNGSSITSLNGSNITSGTVANARLVNSGALTVSAGTGLTGGGSVVLGGTTTLTLANTTVSTGSYGSASDVATFTVDQQGRLTAAGSTPIAIAGSQITSGTVADARLSSNVAFLNGTQTFTGTNTFSSANALVLSSLPTAGATNSMIRMGSALVGGNANGTYISANPATYTGDFFNFQVNGVSQLRASAGGALTAISFNGDGASVTNLNGSNVASGTVANARLVNGGALTVNPGNGLSGGGSTALGGSTTLNVVAGDGIQVGANVAVDNTVCRTSGNCAGTGTGVTASTAGTPNRVAKFTAGQAVANSTIEDDGTKVSILGSVGFFVQGGSATLGSNVQNGSLNIFGSGFAANIQTGTLTANRNFTLPDASGEICTTSGNCNTGGGGGSASNSASYLTLSLDGSLTNERSLAVGTNLSFTDGGANGNYTLNVVNNPTFGTSVSSPIFTSTGALAVTPNGAMTLGSTSQTALVQGSTTTITSTGATAINGGTTTSITSGAGNAITLNSGSTVEILDATNITGALTASGAIRFSSLNCSTFTNGGSLTTDASGNLVCSNDDGGAASALSGSGTTGRLSFFNGTNNLTDSWFFQNTSTLELDNTRNLSLLGGNLSVTGTGTFSGSVTASSFSGVGTALTALNGSNISSGTVANARLVNSGALSITGGNSGLTGGGSVALGGTTSLSVAAGDGIQISSGVAVDNTVCRTSGNCAGSGTGVTATTAGTANRLAMFSGSGQNIGDSYLIQSGSTLQLDNTRSLSLLGGNLNVTGNGDFSGTVTGGLFSGSGASLTALNGSNISSGTVANARLVNSGALTVAAGTGFSGGGSVALGGTTTLNLANTSVSTGSYGSAGSVSTFTVDAQGRLTAAGNTAIAISGAQVTSGTIADARLSSNVAFLNGTQTFTGSNTFSQGNDAMVLNTTPVAGATNSLIRMGNAIVGGNGNGTYIGINPTAYTGDFLNFQINGVSQIRATSGGALTAVSFTGDGANVTNLNGSNVATGTVANARLVNSGALSVTAGGGLINGGSVALGGSTTLNIGAGSGITVNADDVAVDSTVCRTSGNCAGLGGNGDVTGSGTSGRVAVFNGAKTLTDSWFLQTGSTVQIDNGRSLSLLGGDLNVTGTGTFSSSVTASSFSGDGSALTALNGSNVSTGTVANARLVNSGALTITAGTGLTGGGSVALGGTTTVNLGNTTVSAGSYGNAGSVGTFTVDAQGRLTAASSTAIAIAGSQITTGTVADARLSTNVALLNGTQTFTNANTFSANADAIILSSAPASSATTSSLRLGNAITGGNANGTFIGANLATFTGDFTNLQVGGVSQFRISGTGVVTANGSGLTNLNASSLSTGTVADARLSTNVALLNGTQTFTGTNTFSNAVTVAGTIAANGGDINSTAGTVNLFNGANPSVINLGSDANAKNITIGNNAGTSALSLQSGTGAINIGTQTGARAINIGTAGSAQAVTVGSANTTSSTILQAGTGGVISRADGVNAFRIQNSAGTVTLFNVDQANTRVTIGNATSTLAGSNLAVTNAEVSTTFRVGDGTNNITLGSQFRLNGSARNTKQIKLTPEYAGAVLDGTGIGSMSAGRDETRRENYYVWTTTQTGANSYDVVVSVPIPSDWSAWAPTGAFSVNSYTSNVAGSAGSTVTVTPSTTGTPDVNALSINPGSAGSWATINANLTSSAIYVAGDTMTVRLKMTATNNSTFQLGNITLSYLSQF